MGCGQPAGGEDPHGRGFEGEVEEIEGAFEGNSFTFQQRKMRKGLEDMRALILLVNILESPWQSYSCPLQDFSALTVMFLNGLKKHS